MYRWAWQIAPPADGIHIRNGPLRDVLLGVDTLRQPSIPIPDLGMDAARATVVGAASVRSATTKILIVVLRRIVDDTHSYRLDSVGNGEVRLVRRADEAGGGETISSTPQSFCSKMLSSGQGSQLELACEPMVICVDSLCQFDLLWCCLSLATVGEVRTYCGVP